MPLVWERAWGGAREGEGKNPGVRCDGNPVGAGLWANDKDAIDQPLPNLEAPDDPVKNTKSRPEPACWACVAPAWEPRRSFAGTYDAKWERDRMPLLPDDFDHAFFMQAHPALQSPKYFVGGEKIGDKVTTHATVLDTVVLMPSEEKVTLTWRVRIPAPHPVTSVQLVQIESREHPAPVEADADAAPAGGARG